MDTPLTPRLHSSASFLLILSLLLSGCEELLQAVDNPQETPVGTAQVPADWYSVYFTDPESPMAESYRGGPDVALARAIEQARLSVDVAAYDLNLWSIRDALIAAHRRGVAVRLVTESDNLDEQEIQDIKEAGVPILGDRREGLMHNKFIVIDHLEVWTGSMNFTVSDAYLNHNNLVRVRSSRLAEDYTREFEEMFTDDLFGPDTRADTPYPSLTVEGVRLEVFFSPDDGTAQRLVELIKGAQQSVYFLAYSLTSDDIAGALLDRHQAGVVVAGVFDESQVFSNTGGEWERLKEAGLDVRVDGNPRNMHHKVLLIDGQIVVTGSYNFSASAERRNDENTLIIYDSRVASQFMVEFERVFAAGQR